MTILHNLERIGLRVGLVDLRRREIVGGRRPVSTRQPTAAPARRKYRVEPTYRPTYKPSLRGSDDDDCVDDEDWFYTTKEGDVFTCDRVAEKTKRCTIRFSETASGRTTTPAKRRAVPAPRRLSPKTVKKAHT